MSARETVRTLVADKFVPAVPDALSARQAGLACLGHARPNAGDLPVLAGKEAGR